MTNLWVFQTNRQAFLDDCRQFETYGVPSPDYAEVSRVAVGDQALLRLKLLGESSRFVYIGPYRISERPRPWVGTVVDRHGAWAKVDPCEGKGPRWLDRFPWCVFLEETEAFTSTPRSLEMPENLPACRPLPQGLSERVLQNLSQDGYLPRTSREGFRTNRGVWVRSRGEYMIDNWFSTQGVVTLYERAVFLDGAELWPDWYIPALDTYVEFLGLKGQPEYDQRWQVKEQLYRRHRLRLVTLDETDLADLDTAIPRKIPGLKTRRSVT